MNHSAGLIADFKAARGPAADAVQAQIVERFSMLADRNARLLESPKMLASQAREFDSNLAELQELKAHITPARRGGAPGAYASAEAADESSYRSGRPKDPSGLAKALVDARFDIKSNPSVQVPGWSMKASTFPASTAWGTVISSTPGGVSGGGGGGIVPMGKDERFLWPLLPSTDTGRMLSIEDYRQTARTLTGTVERAIDATTAKATVDVTLALVTEALKQEAVLMPSIPNAILQNIPTLDTFMASEGRFQIDKALDAHVLAQIVAATPAFGNTGTGLIAQVRNGIATMRAGGANPTILVVNPTDLAALDLSVQPTVGGYIFPLASTGSSSPLWNLKVVERIGSAGTDPPYLIDPQMLGTLYLGAMQFDADPFSEFSKNLTTLRVEVNCLYHVRNIAGARRIAAT
jgi:hypothetical protein